MDSSKSAGTGSEAGAELAKLQRFLTLPRETLPRLTAQEAGHYLRGAAERLELEYIEIASVAPTFVLLPATAPEVTLFQTWHAEPGPVAGAVEGAERLALGVAIAGARGSGPATALVVAPAATAGSRGLAEALREHRSRLEGGAAYWIRVLPPAGQGGRRNVFLGARGRVVIALRGGDGNPYRARDAVVEELREQAYGPRPLDFELLRKLASRQGTTEAELRAALFDPRGDVILPQVAHPDRPRAWLSFETAEAMEAEPIMRRVQSMSGGGEPELVEHFPWDRANIHHPAIHALIGLSREVTRGSGATRGPGHAPTSDGVDVAGGPGGAEIWPSSPWPTPSGLFTRALGVGLAEWGIPMAGSQVRFPTTDEFAAMAGEAALLLKAARSG